VAKQVGKVVVEILLKSDNSEQVVEELEK